MWRFSELKPGRYAFERSEAPRLELHVVRQGSETVAEWRTERGEPLLIFTPPKA